MHASAVYKIVSDCGGAVGVGGVLVTMPDGDVLSAYAGVFQASDGSTVSTSDGSGGGGGNLGGTGYVRTLMRMAGADVGPTPGDPGSTSIMICGPDVARLAMLGAMGNLVTSPGDAAGSGAAVVPGGQPFATVVVDAYTGKLAFLQPYSSMRTFFLEAMLVISILAIARLSLVTKETVVLKDPSK